MKRYPPFYLLQIQQDARDAWTVTMITADLIAVMNQFTLRKSEGAPVRVAECKVIAE